jgi:DNA-binding response OmpR family regulator
MALTVPDVIRAGPVEVRPGELMATAGGQPLHLSVHEFRLLCVLAARTGRIVTREELFALVWGGALRRGDRSVDVYVRKLRVKFAAARLGPWR